jgi:hypothetical protein
MKTAPIDPRQPELALSSIDLGSVFNGRLSLYVWEVSKVIGVTERHVIDLIGEWHDSAGKSGMEGFSIANTAGNATPRAAWRVPVAGLQKFLNARTKTVVPETTQPATPTQ